MSWSAWKKGPDAWVKHKQEGRWVHMLVAHLSTRSDAERDQNHIHVKFVVSPPNQASVVCSVKVDGMHKVNRRQLIEAIKSRVGDIDLDYLLG